MAKSILLRFLAGKGKLRFYSASCLLAILANLIIPLAHQYHGHLHILDGSSAACVIASGQTITPEIEAGDSEEGEHHSHHNPDTCPICQTVLQAGCFTIPTVNSSPVPYLEVQRFCLFVTIAVVVNPDSLNSRPRSPPISF